MSTMLGARVEIIVYATHSLVVERSITKHRLNYGVSNGFAANRLIFYGHENKIFLQFTQLSPRGYLGGAKLYPHS
jgi:hypothetical protein